ncbi:type II toxin-antitoxin system RelE/ParE family toxin [Olivibacter jilunii]|uniref:type II toxin-antitoxin system RelE/ParE family toxin n=1 Tax=Olivibacter TaxID=376469 RepID=UPI0010320814
MRSVKLLERAEKELYASIEWYEEQQKGLSSKFIKRIAATLNSVKSSPLIFPIRTGDDIRFAPVKVFPFVIIYWFDQPSDVIYVISIFHTSRAPNYPSK